MTTTAARDIPAGDPSGEAVLRRAVERVRLQRSVAATLRLIAVARTEREAPPVHAARQRLAAVYGETRLRRRREHDAA